MKKTILYFTIILVISSCNKDDFSWNLKRVSPKDAKLEVSELIYSNNCSTLSGFQYSVIGVNINTPSNICLGVGSGILGDCIRTENETGTDYIDKFTIEFNAPLVEDCILRFYTKANGREVYTLPSIYVNTDFINSTLISEDKRSEWYKEHNYGISGEWYQIQTGIIKKGSNVKIVFSYPAHQLHIDEIEFWSPSY